MFERLNGNPRVDSVEDIDARLDELTNAIHEAMAASAPKRQPAKQPLVSIHPTILANILEKNRLRRQYRLTGTLLARIESSPAKVDWNRAQGVEEFSMD